MKIQKREFKGDVIGIELISENREEEIMLRRFFDGGVKVNAINMSKDVSLELTFRDLIGGE